MTDRELMDRIRGLYEVKEPDVLPRLKFSEVEMVTAEPTKPHRRYISAAAIYAAACLVLVIALPFIIGRGDEPAPTPGAVPGGTPAVETSGADDPGELLDLNIVEGVPEEYHGVLRQYRSAVEAIVKDNIIEIDGNMSSPYEPVHTFSSGMYEAGHAMEEPATERYGYSLKDMNGDGVPELLLITDNHVLLEIYTIVDGEARMADYFRPRYTGLVLENGELYTKGSNSAVSVDYTLSKLGENGELAAYLKLGRDQTDEGQEYYILTDGEKTVITEGDYNDLLESYPAVPGFSGEDNTMPYELEFYSIVPVAADDPIRNEETVEFNPPAQIPEIYRELVESAEEDYRASGKWDGDDSYLDPEQIKDFDLAEYQHGLKKKGEYYQAVAAHFMETVREKYPEAMEIKNPDFRDAIYYTPYISISMPMDNTNYFILEPDKLDDSREGYAKMYLFAYMAEDMYVGKIDPVAYLEGNKYSGDPSRRDIGDVIGVTRGGTFYWHNIGAEAWATAELCDNMDEIRAAYDEISVKVRYEYYEEHLGKDAADKLVPEYDPPVYNPELTVKERVMAAMERAIAEGRVEDKDYDWDKFYIGTVFGSADEPIEYDDDLFTFSFDEYYVPIVYCDGEVYPIEFDGTAYSVYRIQYCDVDGNGVKDMLLYGSWGSGVDGRALSYFDSNTKTTTHLYSGAFAFANVVEETGDDGGTRYSIYACITFGDDEHYVGTLEYGDGGVVTDLIHDGTLSDVVIGTIFPSSNRIGS